MQKRRLTPAERKEILMVLKIGSSRETAVSALATASNRDDNP
jgi:hypothetical protein